jgi:hypothetical protein
MVSFQVDLYPTARLVIDFSSHGAILLRGVTICIALFGIEEQFV